MIEPQAGLTLSGVSVSALLISPRWGFDLEFHYGALGSRRPLCELDFCCPAFYPKLVQTMLTQFSSSSTDIIRVNVTKAKEPGLGTPQSVDTVDSVDPVDTDRAGI